MSKKLNRPNKGGGKFNHPKTRSLGANRGETATTKPASADDRIGRKGGKNFDLSELYYPDDDEEDDDDGLPTTFNNGVVDWKSGAEKKPKLKVQLQTLHLTAENQELVRNLLKRLHSDKMDSALSDKPVLAASDAKKNKGFVDKNHHLGRHYWTKDNKMRLEGVMAFGEGGTEKDCEGKMMQQEKERVNRWALKRLLESGFDQVRAQEALEANDGDVGASLEFLLQEAFNVTMPPLEQDWEEVRTMREDETMAISSIYGDMFQEKIPDKLWIIKLQLDHLDKMVERGSGKEKVEEKTSKLNRPICSFFAKGKCRYGKKCMNSHSLPPKGESEDSERPLQPHELFEKALKIEESHAFRLELRFPKGNMYPHHEPFISFSCCKEEFPHPLCLLITERLVEEARTLSESSMPIVFSLIGILEDENEMKRLSQKPRHPYSLPPTVKSARQMRFDEKIEVDDTADNFKKHYIPDKLDDAFLMKLNREIIENFQRTANNPKYIKMLQSRQNLPAWNDGPKILDYLGKQQVLVISGMTGCGKTTQVPQFVLDETLLRGHPRAVANIICTQPRRISAIGVAERVADERAERIGKTVGYQIRMESKMSRQTRLLFCTTGILLRRMEADRLLEGVTHVVVDEVHERSEESDFLLLILRDMLPLRPDLKVILMSATVDAELFSGYFGNCPVIEIPGRTFPVQQFFLEDMIEAAEYKMDGNSHYSRMEALGDRRGPSIDEQLDECYGVIRAMENRAKMSDDKLTVRQLCSRYYGFSRSTVRTLAMYDFDTVNLELIEETLKFIVEGDHGYPRTGAVLIFLPGIQEISNAVDQLACNPMFGNPKKFRLLPLHSSLSTSDQQRVFAQVPHGVRKIVLSTNIAETSVTIDDVVFVIDCGKMKEKHYDSSKGMESLDMVWVSRANAMQRKGRAGRVCSGVAFHMFTSHRFTNIMRQHPIPEIHRVPLEQMLLRIKSLPVFKGQALESVLSRTLEAPEAAAVSDAVRRLQDLGALDSVKQLTPLGYHLALLPLDVRLGKLILYGAMLQCTDAAVTIAAMMTSKSPFVSPFGSRDLADRKKLDFAIGNSDHLTMWNAYNKWISICKNRSLSAASTFANDNFLSVRTMEEIAGMKRQFVELLSSIGFIESSDPTICITRRRAEQFARETRGDGVIEVTGPEANRNTKNLKVISAVLVGALYPNVVQVRTPETKYQSSATGTVPQAFKTEDIRFATKEDGYISIHPSSVNFKTRNYESPYLVYMEKIRTSKIYIRDCTMVPLYALALFGGGQLHLEMDRGEFILFVDNGWLTFKVSSRDVGLLTQALRDEIDLLLREKIDHADEGLSKCPRGNLIVETVAKLLSTT